MAEKDKKESKVVYFVSKYPELSITMIAEEMKMIDGKTYKQKAHRILFVKQVKPRQLRGTGFLESGDPDKSDRNDSPYWGLYNTSNEEELEFLRNHEYYKATTQDNKVERQMKLKELSWDPSGMAKGLGRGVVAQQVSFDEKDIMVASVPSDSPAEGPKARVGLKK